MYKLNTDSGENSEYSVALLKAEYSKDIKERLSISFDYQPKNGSELNELVGSYRPMKLVQPDNNSISYYKISFEFSKENEKTIFFSKIDFYYEIDPDSIGTSFAEFHDDSQDSIANLCLE